MNPIFNDHNVYVLGAGFSAMRGLPLVSDFMFKLRDAHPWLIENQRIEEAAPVQRVLQFRLDSTPTAYRVNVDLENIEELFSLASAAGDRLSTDIRYAIAATLDYCLSSETAPTTAFRYSPKELVLPESLTRDSSPANVYTEREYRSSSYEFIVAALLGLLNSPQPRSLNTIITFNYDLLVDEALSQLELPFSYGLGEEEMLLDASAEKMRIVNNAELKLLKLHGSINWALANGPRGQLTVYHSYEDVRRAQAVPELVPPTWRKSFAGPLAGVWATALTRISQATRLVVIGFSMPATDVHFKYLLAAGLRENISLREIVFVNSDGETVTKRAEDLFGDLRRRPSVRIAAVRTSTFINNASVADQIWSIGRPMHPALQVGGHSKL